MLCLGAICQDKRVFIDAFRESALQVDFVDNAYYGGDIIWQYWQDLKQCKSQQKDHADNNNETLNDA
jgi:hypothetical protein